MRRTRGERSGHSRPGGVLIMRTADEEERKYGFQFVDGG